LGKVLQQYSPVSQSLRKTHNFPHLVRESSSFIPQRKSDLSGDSGEGARGIEAGEPVVETEAGGVTGAALTGAIVGFEGTIVGSTISGVGGATGATFTGVRVAPIGAAVGSVGVGVRLAILTGAKLASTGAEVIGRKVVGTTDELGNGVESTGLTVGELTGRSSI